MQDMNNYQVQIHKEPAVNEGNENK